jgi:hypothetical protein
VDRWFSISGATSKFSIGQNAGAVTPPAGFTNYLGLTSLSAYSLLSGNSFAVRQLIEGFNASDLGWGSASASSVTLSFWVRSSLTGTFGGSLRNSAQTRSYPFAYTINTANTWEYKTVYIVGDTSGTWLTNNGIGINVQFSIGSASDISGTAGAWSGSNFASATGAVSVVGTNGATWYITGVQLEKGSVATPFEFRSIGQELALCQRYFQRLGNTAYAGIGTGFQQTTSISLFVAKQNVVMRASPSLGFSQLIVTDRTAFDLNALSIGGVATSPDSLYFSVTHDVAGVANKPVFLTVKNGTTGYLDLLAEL